MLNQWFILSAVWKPCHKPFWIEEEQTSRRSATLNLLHVFHYPPISIPSSFLSPKPHNADTKLSAHSILQLNLLDSRHECNIRVMRHLESLLKYWLSNINLRNLLPKSGTKRQIFSELLFLINKKNTYLG